MRRTLFGKYFLWTQHTSFLNFTDKGKVYWMETFKIPQSSRTTKGKYINNLIQIENEEQVRALIPLQKTEYTGFICLLTEKGILKRVAAEAFKRPRTTGLIALTISEKDTLMDAKVSTGENNVFIATSNGQAILF